jgi:hypothetical protein
MSWIHLTDHHHIPLYNPILLFKEISGTLHKEDKDLKDDYEKCRSAEELEEMGDLDAEMQLLNEIDKEARAKKLYDSYQRIDKEISLIKSFICGSKP